MARLQSWGIELQSLDTTFAEFTTAVNGTPAVETTDFRSGAAAIRINGTAVIENVQHVIAAAQGVRFYRVYIRPKAWPTATRDIIFISNGANRKVGIRLETEALGKSLQLWNEEDGAQVGSDSTALALDTWYRVQFKVDSTTLASTTVEAKLDDAAAFASGTIDITADPNRFAIGIQSTDATLDVIYDDIAVNDNSGSIQNDYPGEGEIFVLRPSAAGDTDQWTRGGTDSGANWSQVEEIPPDGATTYVESNTSGQIDDYNLGATPAAMASDDVVNCVQVGVQFAISATTGADPDFVLRIKDSGGTLEESANISGAGSTTYTSYQTASPKNYALTLYDLPGASTTGWTKTELDAAQIGIRQTVTDTHFARVSAIWLLVDHKPASATSISVSTQAAEAIAEGVDATVLAVQNVSLSTQTAENIGEGAEASVATQQTITAQTQAAEGLAEGTETSLIIGITQATQSAEALAEGAETTVSTAAEVNITVSTQAAEGLGEGADATVATVWNVTVSSQPAEAIGEGSSTTVSAIQNVTVASESAEGIGEGANTSLSLDAVQVTSSAECIGEGANTGLIVDIALATASAEAITEGTETSVSFVSALGLFDFTARGRGLAVTSPDRGLTVTARSRAFTKEVSR